VDAARVIRVAETLTPTAGIAGVYDAGFARFRAAKEALTPINHETVRAIREAK
jgi:xylulokinase